MGRPLGGLVGHGSHEPAAIFGDLMPVRTFEPPVAAPKMPRSISYAPEFQRKRRRLVARLAEETLDD